MHRLPATTGNGDGTTAIQNSTLSCLADQLQVITDTLVTTQRESAEAKAESAKAQVAASEARAENVSLQAQLDCQKEKRAGGYRFKHLGNELTYFGHIDVVSKLNRGLSSLSLKQCDKTELLIRESVADLLQQNKYVKIADGSHLGWALVQELLGNEFAETADEDRKLKRAEQSVEARFKRKSDADQRFRGPAKKVGEQAVEASSPTYVQIPPQAYSQINWAPGAPIQTLPGQIIQTQPPVVTDIQGKGNQTQTGGPKGRTIGPCFHCQGPHLVRNCPQLQHKSAEVQEKIEDNFNAT